MIQRSLIAVRCLQCALIHHLRLYARVIPVIGQGDVTFKSDSCNPWFKKRQESCPRKLYPMNYFITSHKQTCRYIYVCVCPHWIQMAIFPWKSPSGLLCFISTNSYISHIPSGMYCISFYSMLNIPFDILMYAMYLLSYNFGIAHCNITMVFPLYQWES